MAIIDTKQCIVLLFYQYLPVFNISLNPEHSVFNGFREINYFPSQIVFGRMALFWDEWQKFY